MVSAVGEGVDRHEEEACEEAEDGEGCRNLEGFGLLHQFQCGRVREHLFVMIRLFDITF